jgi:Rho GTPase-activating protein 17
MQQQNPIKTTQLKDDQEECELKLEKERDIYASLMFELLAEEESISSYIINYIKYQELCYKSALKEIEEMMVRMNDFMSE